MPIILRIYGKFYVLKKVKQSKPIRNSSGKRWCYESTKDANTFKDLYSELAGNLKKKLPVEPIKFINSWTK